MTDTDHRLLIGLHRSVLALDRETARLAASHGLTLGQFAVMEALYVKGTQSISAVRERILSSVGTIPVIVRNLERRGLIRRLPHATDRRVCLVSLSEEGRKVIAEVIPQNNAMIRDFFAGLDPSEKETLIQLIRKTKGNSHGTHDHTAG